MFKNDILAAQLYSVSAVEKQQLIYQVDIYCNIGTCRVSSSILSQIPIQIESCRMFFITTSVCSQVILQEVLPFLHKNVEWLGKPHYSTSVSHISEGWILSLKAKIATSLYLKTFSTVLQLLISAMSSSWSALFNRKGQTLIWLQLLEQEPFGLP